MYCKFTQFQRIYKLLKKRKKFLIPILYHVPKRFESRIIMELSIRKFKAEINKLELEKKITNGNFGYIPIPGIQLTNLSKTKEVLKNYKCSIFEIEHES